MWSPQETGGPQTTPYVLEGQESREGVGRDRACGDVSEEKTLETSPGGDSACAKAPLYTRSLRNSSSQLENPIPGSQMRHRRLGTRKQFSRVRELSALEEYGVPAWRVWKSILTVGTTRVREAWAKGDG